MLEPNEAMRDALSAFAGRWNLEREIRDRRAGQTHHFQGQATYTPDGDGLGYHEVGYIRLGAQAPLHAERRYRWRASGDEIAVLFEDGRPFHTFVPSKSAEATHHCPPDVYHVEYRFEDWPRWQATWSVQGPRKDYTMVSRYWRDG